MQKLGEEIQLLLRSHGEQHRTAGPNLRTLTGHTDAVTMLRVSPDGQRIVSASNDETLKIWDAATGAVLHTLTGHTNRQGPARSARTGSGSCPPATTRR